MTPLGIYIHIPFCGSKCGYCDFYSLAGSDHLMDAYVKALIAHINECGRASAGLTADTLYFGGGTPTRLGAKRLCQIIDAVERNFPLTTSAELTVEANPDTIGLKDIKKLRKAGINRLSIGIQSANDDELHQLGRTHTFNDAYRAFETARMAGFDNLSVDLMYGLPGQTRSGWMNTLRKTAELFPDHISCYSLKLGDTCRMANGPSPVNLPDDDVQADMYLDCVAFLEDAGLAQYEISNFAKPSRQSRHNLKYWNLDPYLGFGASAHSDFSGRRYSYVSDISAYINGISAGDTIIDSFEPIILAERATEYLMLRLRTTAGVSQGEFSRKFRADFTRIEDTLVKYRERGLAVNSGSSWRLTPEGFLLSNRIILDVLDSLNGAIQHPEV